MMLPSKFASFGNTTSIISLRDLFGGLPASFPPLFPRFDSERFPLGMVSLV